jgi:hypothetical protein
MEDIKIERFMHLNNIFNTYLYRLVYIIFTYGLFDTIAGSLVAAMGQMSTGDQVTNQD